VNKDFEGQCHGQHRYFVCETVFDEKTRTAMVILACTACGVPKVNEISLKKEN
jgi:hypothetical protein